MGAVIQRVPGERGKALPRRGLTPGVRHSRMRLAARPRRPGQGRGVDPRTAAGVGRTTSRRGGDPRRHLPVPQQHRFSGEQLWLSRELPDHENRRTGQVLRGADPVLRHPTDLLRRRQGPAHRTRRGSSRYRSARNTYGRESPPQPRGPVRSSIPATSLTPTPTTTDVCT